MRKVNKEFRPIPEKLLQCFEAKQDNLLAKEKEHSFDANCYNKSIKDDLKILYHNKCAFCESELNEIPKDNYQFTVEHFRPKNIYFWLGYEWSNLMPSCRKCNEKKDNNFQIPDKRQQQTLPFLINSEGQKLVDLDKCFANYDGLLTEKADLLHPEIENPMSFLQFDVENLGMFIWEKANRRAKYTIGLCLLNRTDLFENRKRIYDNYFSEIKEQLVQLVEIYGNEFGEKELQLAFNSILKRMYYGAISENIIYCSFRYFLIENFEVLFINKVPTEMQDILKTAFSNFIDSL